MQLILISYATIMTGSETVVAVINHYLSFFSSRRFTYANTK